MKRDQLVTYLNTLLKIEEYPEEGNGLQFFGKDEVNRIGCAVDAFYDSFVQCVQKGGDLLLTHHGISRSLKNIQVIDQITAHRLKPLFLNDLNVYGVHLPLDGHETLGNNFQLSKMLELQKEGTWAEFHKKNLGVYGKPFGSSSPTELNSLVDFINSHLKTSSVVLPFGPKEVTRLGICSGGASTAIPEANQYGIDTILLGEIPYSGQFLAMEYGVNIIAAGHYKTETLGVQAVCKHLEETFGVPWFFIDFDFKL